MLFPKIGIDKVKALIPGVNFIECMKAVGRPGWHAAYLLIPIVNFFVFASMCIQLVRSFKKYGFKHSAAAVVYAPAAFAKLATDANTKYDGPYLTKFNAYNTEVLEAKEKGNDRQYKKLIENNPFKKSAGREWVESIFFAVFAAAFIRMFLIEAFVIPTPSMEGSLNVGDYLFVSKAHYGIRTPMTVAMIPLLHNRIPGLNMESYSSSPSLPYFRLPALESLDRNEPFVFNWPVGDSVYVTKMRPYSVEQVEREPGLYEMSDPELKKIRRNKDFVVRPIDKKDHYIKRCVGMPGDNFEIIDGQIFIDGKASKNPEHLQFAYNLILPPGVQLSSKKLEEWGVDKSDFRQTRMGNEIYIDSTQVQKIKSLDPNIILQKRPDVKEPKKLYPHAPKLFPNWSNNNYGPIWIPKKGETIELTPENIALYSRVIDVYENNDYSRSGNTVTINGETATSYTFKQNYYWAMGDNRLNSEDSRAWGFVPGDHVVGKPLFIWFSKDETGINWDRIFKSANDMD